MGKIVIYKRRNGSRRYCARGGKKGYVREVTAAWCLSRILGPGDSEKTYVRWMEEIVAIVSHDVVGKSKNSGSGQFSGYWFYFRSWQWFCTSDKIAGEKSPNVSTYRLQSKKRQPKNLMSI